MLRRADVCQIRRYAAMSFHAMLIAADTLYAMPRATCQITPLMLRCCRYATMLMLRRQMLRHYAIAAKMLMLLICVLFSRHDAP